MSAERCRACSSRTVIGETLAFRCAENDVVRRQIATGEERFERGGRSPFQSLCVQLARMGCVVWQWDVLGDSDSLQLSHELIHGFSKQRPDVNTEKNWGLFSPQAEAHLQSVMGLQTWNSIRSLDFLLSLPEVDPERIAMTGASGGGTQTMLLAAVDPRLTLSFPVVMVSTAMQGGCTCENASLLRVDTGNVEFAALFAPKPQGMTTANDWTKELSTKGFPELQKLYALLGAPENVMLARGEHFPHNYNAVSRSAFYTWLNRHFKLGQTEPVIERDYEPLTREQLTVWDDAHPAPKADDLDFERKLLTWFTDDAEKQLQPAHSTPAAARKTLADAIEVLIGRTYATAGDVTWTSTHKRKRNGVLAISGLLRNTTYDEELPVEWLFPANWNGQVVVWLGDSGKSIALRFRRRPYPCCSNARRWRSVRRRRRLTLPRRVPRGWQAHHTNPNRSQQQARKCRLHLRLQPFPLRPANARRAVGHSLFAHGKAGRSPAAVLRRRGRLG